MIRLIGVNAPLDRRIKINPPVDRHGTVGHELVSQKVGQQEQEVSFEVVELKRDPDDLSDLSL